MQCEQFEQRMQALLDRRRQPEYDSRLLAHAQTCPACQEKLAAQELLWDALDWGPPIEEPDAAFAWRVVRQAQAFEASRRAAALRGRAAAAVAAVLLLALGTVWWNRREAWSGLGLPDAGPSRSSLVQAQPAPRSTSPRHGFAVERMPLPVIPRDGRDAPAFPPYSRHPLPDPPRVSPNAGSETHWPSDPAWTDHTGHLQLEMLPPLLAELHGESLAQVDQLAVGLRPIASSLSVAFDALRRSLPLGRDPRSPDRRAHVSWLPAVPA